MTCTFCGSPDALWEGMIQGQPVALCFSCWKAHVHTDDEPEEEESE